MTVCRELRRMAPRLAPSKGVTALAITSASPANLLGSVVELEAKLQPERIRATLAFAGLYKITHGLIQRAALDDMREVFCTGFDENGVRYDETTGRDCAWPRDAPEPAD